MTKSHLPEVQHRNLLYDGNRMGRFDTLQRMVNAVMQGKRQHFNWRNRPTSPTILGHTGSKERSGAIYQGTRAPSNCEPGYCKG